ncbi:DNA-processing protein DprA [Mycoplasma todarodis]|uniref:DNA-processing protein DprA n=1 Tax=Mycoplasma todarodis TaxID=1937191 RepID=A0A4R0XLQ7_9MOLU|nr:DNA-processing protein DprA [Mycoplasma todarodis]TCG10362.1 DNA-processing protein DprA [Mycoplasma todarodis]
MNIILIWFAIKYKGDWDKIYQALEEKEKVSLRELKELERKMEKQEVNAITILDLGYPNQLKKAYKPPFVLFYKGNIDILKRTFMCASGNELNLNIKKWINNSIEEITYRHALVSSIYKGVDQFVLKRVLENKKDLLVVSANDVEEPFLATNVEPGEHILVISEYPSGTNIKKERLKARNRIVAAFAESLVLFSSEKDGGIMNLVSQFLNQGKEIYCFPGMDDGEDGNTELIKQGANLITSIKDIDK